MHDIATPSAHDKLVASARAWLHKKGCCVVITELSSTGEEADAIGWTHRQSILIECKTSLSDFRADGQKYFRRESASGVGMARYYCAPAGLIAPAKLPEKWGLLELRDRALRQVRPSGHFAANNARQEITMLLSTLRRVGQAAPPSTSIRCYTLTNKQRATLGVLPLPPSLDTSLHIAAVVGYRGYPHDAPDAILPDLVKIAARFNELRPTHEGGSDGADQQARAEWIQEYIEAQ